MHPNPQHHPGVIDMSIQKQHLMSDCRLHPPVCRKPAIWLQSGSNRSWSQQCPVGLAVAKIRSRRSESRARPGHALASSTGRLVTSPDLQSGRFFLQSGPFVCNLHSGFVNIVRRNNVLAKTPDCRIQIAERLCNLRKPAPHKAFSQIADCRNSHNYVSNRMTRYRGHSVTDLGARSPRAAKGGDR